MGFGFLFFGYFITFLISSFVPYGYAFSLIGMAVIFKALTMLKDYEKTFSHVAYPLGLYVLTALWRAASDLLWSMDLFGDSAVVSTLLRWERLHVEQILSLIAVVAFHAVLLLAIARLAREVELNNLRVSAIVNLIAVSLYGLLYALFAFIPVLSVYAGYLSASIVLLQLAWTILDLILIYRCHMHICPEGDEDMPRKPSRIPFIRRLDEELDRREEKAMQQTLDYRRQKISERQKKIEDYKRSLNNNATKKKKKKK